MGNASTYYDILGITRDADAVAIKTAFRRLALRYHPDAGAGIDGTTEFVRVCEAYDVLSNHKTKGIYDLYGEEHLKAARTDGEQGYTFDASCGPQAVFARFFGTHNPCEALQDLVIYFKELSTTEKATEGKQEMEIAHGAIKAVTHTRRVLDQHGNKVLEQRSLAVDVKPGAPDGAMFVFKGEGDIIPGQPAGSIAYVLKAAQHERFSRNGADLVHRVKLPLSRALAGGSITVQTLDDRTLQVPLDGIVAPGHRTVIEEEGLPKPDGGKGNLVLEFHLLFPAHLRQDQKHLLLAAFLLPTQLSPEQSTAIRALHAAFTSEKHGWSTGFAKH